MRRHLSVSARVASGASPRGLLTVIGGESFTRSDYGQVFHPPLGSGDHIWSAEEGHMKKSALLALLASLTLGVGLLAGSALAGGGASNDPVDSRMSTLGQVPLLPMRGSRLSFRPAVLTSGARASQA